MKKVIHNVISLLNATAVPFKNEMDDHPNENKTERRRGATEPALDLNI